MAVFRHFKTNKPVISNHSGSIQRAPYQIGPQQNFSLNEKRTKFGLLTLVIGLEYIFSAAQ
jgi:hypothetical protein